ncbi:exosortase K [Flavobacterium sp.]|uniref:exosortase K n=1 Tax=Flavobacterium sp. TaxID=239 RepID=UPI003D0D23C3
MKLHWNTLGYFFTAISFVLLKLFYRNATVSDLKILLAPTKTIVSWVTNSTAIFSPQMGYYFKDLHLTIDKSCSGFNFFSLLFCMFCFVIIKEFNHNAKKWKAILISFGLTYLVTILANTSRILIAIYTKKIIPQPLYQKPWMHETQGILVYLLYFIIIYNVTTTYINKLNHEKIA